MTLSDRLTQLVKDRDYTLRELAKKVGVSHVSIGKWMRGEQKPTDENIEALAELFSVTPAFLRYGDTSFNVPQILEPNDDEISIPVVNVSASCGTGITQFEDLQLVRMLRVSKEWLASHGLSESISRYLHIITADGDSMEPDIKKGDFVIVDTSQRSFSKEGIYAVQYSNNIFIKRVQILPRGKVVLLSDNPRYNPITLDEAESVDVIGRCLFAFNLREI